MSGYGYWTKQKEWESNDKLKEQTLLAVDTIAWGLLIVIVFVNLYALSVIK